VVVYNALLYAHYHVPVHSIILLLRPEALHSNMTGSISYAPRPGHGNMSFGYQLVPLWERPATELLAADLGVTPLAMLGRLPEDLSLEDGLTAVARQLVDRLTKEAPPDRVSKLLTDAWLLTGLRVRRDAAVKIFRGVRAMHESDTYLMILEEGEEKRAKKDILLFGEELLGPANESVKAQLAALVALNGSNGWSAALRRLPAGKKSWRRLEVEP